MNNKYITYDKDILNGTPVITGTRIDVYTVEARLEGMDTVEDLVREYPDVPAEAFLAAHRFAKGMCNCRHRSTEHKDSYPGLKDYCYVKGCSCGDFNNDRTQRK